MRMRAALAFMIIVCPWFAGCAGLQANPPAQPGATTQPAKRATVRFYLASAEEVEGYHQTVDEAGQPLYVAADPLLSERDIHSAAVFRSKDRNLVRLDFTPIGGRHLERVTRANLGRRLAVFVDDVLIMSPMLTQPIDAGTVYLDGEFTAARADALTRGLNVRTGFEMPEQRATEKR